MFKRHRNQLLSDGNALSELPFFWNAFHPLQNFVGHLDTWHRFPEGSVFGADEDAYADEDRDSDFTHDLPACFNSFRLKHRLRQGELSAPFNFAFEPPHFRFQVRHIGVETCTDDEIGPLPNGRINPVDASVEFAEQLNDLETVQVVDAACPHIGCKFRWVTATAKTAGIPKTAMPIKSD